MNRTPRQLIMRSWSGHRVLQVPHWHDAGIIHGFGTRGAEVAPLLEGMRPGQTWQIPLTHQVHGTIVHHIACGAANPRYVGDAFSTDVVGVACPVRTADCVPILMCDRRRGVVAAVHAGWRSQAAGILVATLDALAAQYACRRADLEVAIGPAIAAADFEVDAPVIEALQAAKLPCAETMAPARAGHWWLDLSTLAQLTLRGAGVHPEQIWGTDRSTYRQPGLFHSFRREPSDPGRQWSVIGNQNP